ncbi:MAG: hypothetical protein Aurels2KO_11830 [Aureliella sp.]
MEEASNSQTDSDVQTDESHEVQHVALPPTSLECRIETYHAISEWIRFADAKAAVILTIGGALAGVLIPSIRHVITADPTAEHVFEPWQVVTLIAFGLYVFFFALSSIFAFLCINPLRNRRGHPSLDHCPLFHPAAISAHFDMNQVDEFIEASSAGGEPEMHRQVQAAILLDSHISAAKYKRVSAALRLFTCSAVFGFVYYLLAQF